MTGSTPQQPAPDLSRLIASAQATTQALNNLNQTQTTNNAQLSNIGAYISDLTSLISGTPFGSTITNGSSGLSTTTTATATITTSGTNQTLYITGYDVSYTGQTTANFAGVVVTGIPTSAGVLLAVPAGATTASAFIYKFPTPVPATGSSISVSFGPLGTGSAGAWVNAYGFYTTS